MLTVDKERKINIEFDALIFPSQKEKSAFYDALFHEYNMCCEHINSLNECKKYAPTPADEEKVGAKIDFYYLCKHFIEKYVSQL